MDIDISKITQAIDQIGAYASDKLKMPFDKALDILYKEYTYQMCWAGVWCFIGLLILIATIIFIKTDIKRKWFDDWDFMTIWIWVIGTISGLIMFFYNGNHLLHGLINPEWYIFEYIIKPLIK